MIRSTPTGLLVAERKPLEGWSLLSGVWLPDGISTPWLPEGTYTYLTFDETPLVAEMSKRIDDAAYHRLLYGDAADVISTAGQGRRREPDRKRFEREAWDEVQPGEWGNVYETVDGELRFRCCLNPFVDGEHAPWCPKQPDRQFGRRMWW